MAGLRLAAGLASVLLVTRVWAATAPPLRDVPNNGTDQTRPRPQAAVLYEFQNLPGPPPDSSSTWTVRGIGRLTFNDQWATLLRIDVPIVLANGPPSDDPGGGFQGGFGNLLNQVGLIYTPNDRWAFAAGSQVKWPTASRATAGSSAYQVLPGAIVRAMLPELSPGSFFAPEALYSFEVGDPGSGELQLQPTLSVQLSRRWFVNLFPSSDIRINLGEPKGSGRVFFPFDALIGVLATPSLQASLEASVPIVKAYPVYDFKLQAKLAYFFD
jgi:hypothetical protein